MAPMARQRAVAPHTIFGPFVFAKLSNFTFACKCEINKFVSVCYLCKKKREIN